MFFCEKCNRHVLNVVPRYRIKVRVIDETDSATFVIFDRDAFYLLNKSCSDMVDSFDKNSGASLFPEEIMDLVDKTYLFKVEVNNGFSARFDQSFRVKRICADAVIIEKFKSLKKFDSSQEDVGEDIGSTGLMQDLMPKFVDATVDSQSDCANAVNLDCSQNMFPETIDATPVYKSFNGQTHIAVEKKDKQTVAEPVNQNLPVELVRRFMKQETKEVEIEDENGNIYVCNVWWGKRPGQAHLTHGWSKFCAENGLMGGSKIQLAINPSDGSKLYSKVISS